jgi:hypothetical protein
MSEREFWKCTPRFWRLKLEGMREAQNQQFKNQWELTRWAVATTMAPHLKKPIEPKRLLTFPWEEPEHIGIEEALRLYSHVFAKLTPDAKA